MTKLRLPQDLLVMLLDAESHTLSLQGSDSPGTLKTERDRGESVPISGGLNKMTNC